MERRQLAIAGLLLVATLPVGAQDPQLPAGLQLPARGPRTIVGIVVDRNTAPSQPLEGVMVTIRGTDRAFITGDDGIFRFDSLPPGNYELRARRIGFEPRVGKATLPDGGNVIFVLTPLFQSLAPIVSSAALGGVGGFVSDTGRNPLKGIAVRIYGAKSGRTVTDSTGQFHIVAPEGQYMMEVTGSGFRSELTSFNIPKDSGRLVAVTLLRGRLPNRDVAARDNMQRRVAWRTFGSRIFTREDLAKLVGTNLTDLVRMAADRPFNEEECQLFLNGLPIAWPMWMYEAEDLEMLEVYPPGTMGGRVAPRRGMQPARDSRGGAARVCPAIFIWQRK